MSSLDPRNMKRNADRIVDARTDRLGRAAGFELARKLMKMTPVDTGRARANWNASVNSPDYSTTGSFSTKWDKEHKHTGFAEAKIQTATRVLKFSTGDTFYMSNGLPYIERLDQGYSQQAAAGIVEPVLQDMKPTIKRIAGDIRRRSVGG
jgi:hypothetical protein